MTNLLLHYQLSLACWYQAQIYLYITFRWDELTEIYTPLNLNNFGETRVGSTEPFSQQFLVIPLHCAKSK